MEILEFRQAPARAKALEVAPATNPKLFYEGLSVSLRAITSAEQSMTTASGQRSQAVTDAADHIVKNIATIANLKRDNHGKLLAVNIVDAIRKPYNDVGLKDAKQAKQPFSNVIRFAFRLYAEDKGGKGEVDRTTAAGVAAAKAISDIGTLTLGALIAGSADARSFVDANGGTQDKALAVARKLINPDRATGTRGGATQEERVVAAMEAAPEVAAKAVVNDPAMRNTVLAAYVDGGNALTDALTLTPDQSLLDALGIEDGHTRLIGVKREGNTLKIVWVDKPVDTEPEPIDLGTATEVPAAGTAEEPEEPEEPEEEEEGTE